MTAQILTSELTTILQESKRKNTEIRSAAEKSLADLKSLSGTSETQLGLDLRKRPHFVQPFLLSCASKNAKLAGPSISCLQRLVISSGVHPDALKDVLEAVRDASALSQDVQLRILQLLPALLQNYGDLVVDNSLITALQVCFMLLGTKNAIVSNTAAATLQQLVVSVFDRIAKEDEDKSLEGLIQDVPKQDGWVSVKRAALDAHRLLNDICLLIEGQKPEHLGVTSLQTNSGLEMVETILSHHPGLISSHPEMVHVLRQKLFPFIIRALSDKIAFSTTVRAVRLLPIIFSHMLEALVPECEMALGLINHLLDPDAGVLWKRVLCMELLRNLHNDSDLMRRVFAQFDQEESRRNIVQDQMAIMVRVASEKPSAIGLGQQSSAPHSAGQVEDEPVREHTEGGSAASGVATSVTPSNAYGISAKYTSMKIPCLDQVDKADPPTIPPTYLYALAVTCMNNFSEGLARFLLPFTVPSESRARRRGQTKDTPQASPKLESLEPDAKRPGLTRTLSRNSSRLPVNPLDLKSHPLYGDLCTSSAMVDKCWPALLAAYSTYFHAALDTDYYRALVRAFQKFTQIAGLLRLETPRDAFLTTLSKNAMPSGPISLLSALSQDARPSPRRTSYSKDEDYSSESGEEQMRSAKSSLDIPRVSLNSRNLLCLRALLNLAIALGPVLGAGWTIILETLQQADFLINHVNTQRRKARGASGSVDEADFLGDISSEVAAVGAAATRMLETTGDLPDKAYLEVVSSLCGLFRDVDEAALQASGARVGERRTSTTTAMTIQVHDSRLNLFVIDQIAKLVKYNNARMLEQSLKDNGWTTMTNTLRTVVVATYLDHNVRIRACKALMNFVGLTASSEVSDFIREETRRLGLVELTRFVDGLYKMPSKNSKVSDEDLHLLGLDTLRSMLELYGDSLSVGWEDVFSIVSSVFVTSESNVAADETRQSTAVACRSAKLMRSSFGSLQLICSDFLASLPSSCLTSLMHSVHAFTNQQEDLNTSLTATTLYSSVADLHWRDQSELHLEDASPMRIRDAAADEAENVLAIVSMRLFQLLSASATDSRMEVRHGAIYSLFRILEGHADRFSSHDWLICIKFVVIPMYSENQKAYESSVSSSTTSSNKPKSEWNETAVLLLENTSTLLGLRMAVLLPIREFVAIWAHIMSHFQTLLSRESLLVSASVFVSVEKIFSASDTDGLSQLVDPAWYLWLNGNPAAHKETTRKIIDNQPALLAYISCFLQLHQLVDGNVAMEQLQPIVEQMQLCATASSPTAYVGDLDTLTPLQSEILEGIKIIKTDTTDAFSLVTQTMARFVTLPFEAQLTPEKKGPTFVALSKTSMGLLKSQLQSPKDISTLYKDGILEIAVSALWKPISLKYVWTLEGKPPTPWQRATTATLQILEATLPAAQPDEPSNQALEKIWKQVLRSCEAMISTGEIDDEPTPPPSEDLRFDVAAVESMCALIIPALGSLHLSDDLRRSFAHILFEHSLIHEPHPEDLPASYKEPLSALRSQHIGRTQDLPPSPRSTMCYKLLATLFELVAVHDGSAERIKLAQAAAPYLILRVALTLKAYISDQPLRGRMPQPRSQRKELLWILRRLVDLEAEPRAIPDMPGVVSQHKKHLFRVVPFVREGLRVARRDAEVHRAFERVLEVLAGEFDMGN